MPDYGLGRLPAPDDRDRNFPFSLAGAPTPTRTSRYWIAEILDQGSRPTCVAFSWSGWLRASPIRQRLNQTEEWLYHEAQLVDEWPGEEPAYTGTSVRAGAKILQREGFVQNYLWASSAEEIKNWILTTSPVIVGTTWYTEMFTPGRDGFVHPRGSIAGGHAWLIYGVSQARGAFRATNSWGRGWGQWGRFWIAGEDLDRLIREDGEAITAVEQRVGA